ncbi:hypothetical protein F5Y19DRAFT_471915 [Xylariaceae sp. FL1651]|nr:hypothetical protein F5Y19DRAFT_471915 [Xylariaceae sp. FL1651]
MLYHMNDMLRFYLKGPNFTINHWELGYIPLECKTRGEEEGFVAADFEVFNVTYTDCDDPWIMCRHKSCTTDPVAMADFQHEDVVAITRNASTMVPDSFWSPVVLAGGMSHTIDLWAGIPGIAPNELFSQSQTWKDQYNLGSATISGYGMESWVTDLAEAGIVALYDLVVPFGVTEIQPNWTQVHHQYATIETYFRDKLTPNSKPKCTLRLTNSDPVAVSGVSGEKNMGSPPDVTFGSSVKIIELSSFSHHTFARPISHNSGRDYL